MTILYKEDFDWCIDAVRRWENSWGTAIIGITGDYLITPKQCLEGG
jgi:hypothetical protein